MRLARGVNKARYAERAIRSFKKLFVTYWEYLADKLEGRTLPNWPLIVRRVTNSLNERFHRSLGCSPNQVTTQWKRVQKRLVRREMASSASFDTVLDLETKGPDLDPYAAFAVGDLVLRIKKAKKGSPDAKESARAFSKTPGRISKIFKEKRPYLYQVKEKKGNPDKQLYYAEELKSFKWHA